MKPTVTKANADNHSNQCNPNHSQYKGGANKANQLNPNNSLYCARGGK